VTDLPPHFIGALGPGLSSADSPELNFVPVPLNPSVSARVIVLAVGLAGALAWLA
jgi:hypothetical protein